MFSLLKCNYSNLYHVYNINYNNNYSFVLQPFCKPYLHYMHTTEMFKHSTQNWLNYYWLLPALCAHFIYARLQSAGPSQSRRFMISPSRELYRESLCMCIPILVYLAWLLLVYLESVRCIVYTLTLVAFFISFILMVFVFVVFAYCFHVNNIRTLRVTIYFARDDLILHLNVFECVQK